jgi:hypothetical protein
VATAAGGPGSGKTTAPKAVLPSISGPAIEIACVPTRPMGAREFLQFVPLQFGLAHPGKAGRQIRFERFPPNRRFEEPCRRAGGRPRKPAAAKFVRHG